MRLDWPYTQSDLAAMIGGTRQSVNKLLSGFVERGLLVIERDSLLIPDVDALDPDGAPAPEERPWPWRGRLGPGDPGASTADPMMAPLSAA